MVIERDKVPTQACTKCLVEPFELVTEYSYLNMVTLGSNPCRFYFIL